MSQNVTRDVGLFKNFFSRKDEILELAPGELAPWIESELLRRNKPLIEKAKVVRARLYAELSSLREIGDDLRSFQPHLGEMEAPFAGAIKAAKEALAMAASGGEDLGPDSLSTVDDIVNLNTRAKRILDHLVNVCQANRKIGYTFLKGQIKRVEKSMRAIARETTTLDRLLESRSGKEIEHCLKLAEELIALNEELKLAESGEQELRKRVCQLEAESSEAAATLQSIKSSRALTEAERLKTELAMIENAIVKLVAPMGDALANLRRALNKYRYLVAHDRKRMSLLAALNTAESLLEWSDKDSLLRLLEDLLRKVNAGELQVKNSQRVLESLNYLHAHTSSHAEKYEATKRLLHEVRTRLNQSCLREVEALEAMIREKEAVKGRLEVDVKEVIGDLKRFEAKIAEKMIQVEEEASRACGVRIKLKTSTQTS